MNAVRIALVGAGSFAQTHLRAYSELPQADVAWVCDTNPEAAQQAAARWGIPRIAADLDEVLADDDVELVDLVTPVGVHAQQAIQVLQAGKSVLCEKPMAATVEQAEAMLRAEADSPGTLYVKYHQRYDPAHERLRELLGTGNHGAPLTAHFSLLGDHLAALRSTTHWRGDPRLAGGGCLTESGSHLIDLAHEWFGAPAKVTAVTHQLAAQNPAKGEDTASMVVEFTSGVVLTLVAFWGAPQWQWRKDVFTDAQSALSVHTGADSVLSLTTAGGTTTILATEQDWFQRSVVAAIKDILTRCASGTPPRVTSAQAFASTRMLAAAATSAAEGRTVELA